MQNRRSFLKGVLAAGAAPAIVPASVLGATAPSNKVQIAIIGCGRIGTTMDISGMAQNEDIAMLTTVCDVDAARLASMKVTVEAFNSDLKMKKGEKRDFHYVVEVQSLPQP